MDNYVDVDGWVGTPLIVVGGGGGGGAGASGHEPVAHVERMAVDLLVLVLRVRLQGNERVLRPNDEEVIVDPGVFIQQGHGPMLGKGGGGEGE